MAGLEAPCELMESLPERGRRGGMGRGAGVGARLGAAMGGMGVAARGRGSRREGSGSAWLLACALLCVLACCSCVREGSKEEGETKKKRKGRKRKEKNLENFLDLKIFREKNKRQFMKLAKNIFV
jgi:hypothetical protein